MTEKICTDRALVRELTHKIGPALDGYDRATRFEALTELIGFELSFVDCLECRKIIGAELMRQLSELIEAAELSARERGEGPPHVH